MTKKNKKRMEMTAKMTSRNKTYEEDKDEEECLQYEKPTASLAGSLGS